MNLTQLKIKNFKCFQEEQTFDFGKITLLTGANSSGKSSVIYAILGALQSGYFPLKFSLNGDYVNMGSFEEIVFNQEKSSKIDISFKFGEHELSNINTTWKNGKYTVPFLDSLIVDSEPILISSMTDLESNYSLMEDIELNSTLEVVMLNFQKYSEKINYIGSYRLDPERTYLEKNRKESRIEKSGEGYLEQITAWETQKSPKFKQLIEEMRSLSLLENIKSKRLEGGRYEFKVRTTKKGIFSSLSDVGYGISQFLPIMVADLQLPNDSQLFVSQPEIHLHPSVQSSFGDYLVSQVNKSDKRYVIETHSEYLLNKIRLAIVKGDLKEEDVSVYYLENENEGAVVHTISFAKNGQILNAPKGFFETYMTDSFEIAINAVE